MERVNEIAAEVHQLCEQYKKEVSAGNRTWPRSIRERAVELQRLELSNGKISQLTGIPVPTLYLWSRPTKAKQYSQKRKGSFLPIKVNESKKAIGLEIEKSPDPLTLTLPNGIKITGLTAGVAIELIRGMST